MTARTLHNVGEFKLQNSPDSATFTPPTQLGTLGVLTTSEPVLWQYDQELGLPVVTNHDPELYMKVYKTYGDPDKNAGGETLTFPIQFTKDAYGGGHPNVNFTRDETLAFITSESVLMSDFPRLYVGTFEDFERLARDDNLDDRVIWGETYQRPAFAPGNERCVREVHVVQAGRGTTRTTRPAAEGWVPSEKLLGQSPNTTPSAPSRGPADDD